MINLREEKIPPENLLLDPNNFRFQDSSGFVYATENRFHEKTVQDRAFQRMRKEESLAALKESILKNGFIPVERVIVRPYIGDETKYVVIEGNRRVSAVKWIFEDYNAGVDIPENILDTIKEVPVSIVEETEENPVFRASLMGIRHVTGIKQWGGYQRAKLVSQMKDELDLPSADVASRLGLSAHEVNRRYRAYKALEQMKDDENYGEFAQPKMYPIYHEAVSLPPVKDWLNWDEESSKFCNEENLEEFYKLICDFSDDDGNIQPPKITTYSQIRQFRYILPKPEAKRILLDPDKDFEEAVNIARQDEFARRWATDVTAAITALKSISIQELKTLDEEDIKLIEELGNLSKERLSDIKTLSSR